jgi:hypothetical protein
MPHKRVGDLTIESHPWYEPQNIELTPLHFAGVASKVTFPERILYSLWQPVPDLPPDGGVNATLDVALYYRTKLKLKGGRLFDLVGQEHFFLDRMKGWTESPQAPRIRRMEKLWRPLVLERMRLNLELIYPEASEGFITSNGITLLTGNRLSTHDLDSITAAKQTLDKYEGFRVSHDIFGNGGTLVKLPCGKFAVRWRITCQSEGKRCKNRTTIYTTSGVHHGAWCYAVDRNGQHLADLRNQNAVCEKCAR